MGLWCMLLRRGLRRRLVVRLGLRRWRRLKMRLGGRLHRLRLKVRLHLRLRWRLIALLHLWRSLVARLGGHLWWRLKMRLRLLRRRRLIVRLNLRWLIMWLHRRLRGRLETLHGLRLRDGPAHRLRTRYRGNSR